MGDKGEYGSFAQFQDRILGGKVTADEADGYVRHIAYERGDRQLDLRWHCYTENYPSRRIGGRDDAWPSYAQSPEFAVNDSGRLAVKDATLTTLPGKTLWLLACAPSHTWVAYQPNTDEALSLALDCPAGRLTAERFPFGKVVVSQAADGSVRIEADAAPAVLRLETKASAVQSRFNGVEGETIRDAAGAWTIRACSPGSRPQ